MDVRTLSLLRVETGISGHHAEDLAHLTSALGSKASLALRSSVRSSTWLSCVSVSPHSVSCSVDEGKHRETICEVRLNLVSNCIGSLEWYIRLI